MKISQENLNYVKIQVLFFKYERKVVAKNILVIDDCPDVADLLKEIFLINGYEVETALSADQALKLISESTPDLIFVDYYMEDMDGVEFIERFYSDFEEVAKETPIVMLTATEENHYPDCRATEITKKMTTPKSLVKIAQKYLDE